VKSGAPPRSLAGDLPLRHLARRAATSAGVPYARHNQPSMRKLYLSLVLPLLMLLAQQGAVRHEISHLGGGHPPAAQGKQQPVDKLCESCLAFAHLAAAAKPDVAALPPAPASHRAFDAEAHAFVAADTPAQRSRGPPSAL
jgi:hypothetical protein